MRQLIASSAVVIGLCTVAARPAAADEAESRSACAKLGLLDVPAFRVDTTEWVAADESAPAHCLFRGTLNARPSSIEGVSLGIGFELRLPLEWNGRFLFQGGGGLNGALNPAVGNVSGGPSALARGFAVVSTDGGHRGRSIVDASFAVDQQAKLDFAYHAVQRTTYEAKHIVNRFYGRAPEYSYFVGCSTGGREGLLAAQRLPLEFDGVVAGDPAFNLTRIAVNQVYSLQTVTRIAPIGADGKPDLSRAFTDAQLRGVADAVTAECDALDGLADGMINDFEACSFDPGSLQCGTARNDAGGQCLAEEQVDALRDIFGGARNSRGESLYGPFTFDTGIANPVWRSMHLGSDGRPPANATLGADTLRLFAMTPARPDLDPLEFDFDRDVALTAETAAINDAIATLHSTFAGRGGKLIIYHGLSDQGMSAGALIDWYAKITPRDDEGPQDWARMFFVPGMTHCAGGQATDTFDMLTAIQAWVEEGRAPDRIIATGRAFPGVTRPLCPYPQVARYDGGDPNSADSFSCR
ncbi:MAG TPA: tannase/feruloyl esterase family alpha/beta hydrolase [Gammaproteobacteria bacterium]